jgi:FixJ family two-component response regulator
MQTGYSRIDLVLRSPQGPPAVVPSDRTAVVPAGGADAEMACVVVADERLRGEISAFLAAQGIEAASYASAMEFLDGMALESSACLIVDMHLPDLNGLDLQQHIASKGKLPAIFLSGPCDASCVIRAMKSGAIEFLFKPIDPTALLAAVRTAMLQQRKSRVRKAELLKLQKRFCSLTPREREVLALIAYGLPNKEAASVLGIATVTLQIHRSHVMRKMEADSFAGLVRMADRLRVTYTADGVEALGRIHLL